MVHFHELLLCFRINLSFHYIGEKYTHTYIHAAHSLSTLYDYSRGITLWKIDGTPSSLMRQPWPFVRSENRRDCWICQEIITDLTSHPVYSSIRERWLLPAYYMPANDNSFSNTIKPYSIVLIHRQLSDFQVFIDLMTNRSIVFEYVLERKRE